MSSHLLDVVLYYHNLESCQVGITSIMPKKIKGGNGIGSVKEVILKNNLNETKKKKKNIFKDVINFEKKYNKLDN